MVQQQEAKYVSEWLKTFHPSALQWKRVRLGLIPHKELGKLYQMTLKWVDAVFMEHGIVYLVEAKLKTQTGMISQLEVYNKLFGETPEFSQFWTLPRKLIALVPKRDIDVENLAAEKGIEYIVYRPDWLRLT